MAAVRRWLTARLPAVLLPPSLKDAAHASRRRAPAPRLASARTHARALKRAWRTYAATLGLDGQASAGARDAEAARGEEAAKRDAQRRLSFGMAVALCIVAHLLHRHHAPAPADALVRESQRHPWVEVEVSFR